MKRRLYCVFDKATRSHMNPLVFVNHGEAVRWFTTVANKEDDSNNIALYPHQFTLRYLGEFDDVSGKFEGDLDDVIEATTVKEFKKKFGIEELIEALDKRYGVIENIEIKGDSNAKRNEL